jgi:hyperosmotically inducible protein
MHNPTRMDLFQITSASVITFALLLGSSSAGRVDAQSTDANARPDNTAVNKRDRSPGAATADQQKMNATDRNITARIRRSIMADKSVSTYAHNVKIISQDGTVTPKGPVRSDDEVKSLVSRATNITESTATVIDQMSAKPTSSPETIGITSSNQHL